VLTQHAQGLGFHPSTGGNKIAIRSKEQITYKGMTIAITVAVNFSTAIKYRGE
jgi:hypothetical protein